MSDSPTRVYWDSNAWIALINEEAGRVGDCESLISRARSGEFQIWTSSWSRVEVVKVRRKTVNKALDLSRSEKFEALLDEGFVYEVAVDRDIANLARALYATHGMKKPQDSVHLAAAVFHNIGELHTYDHDDLIGLDGSVELRNGAKLAICEVPPPPAGGDDPGSDLFRAEGDDAAQTGK